MFQRIKKIIKWLLGGSLVTGIVLLVIEYTFFQKHAVPEKKESTQSTVGDANTQAMTTGADSPIYIYPPRDASLKHQPQQFGIDPLPIAFLKDNTDGTKTLHAGVMPFYVNYGDYYIEEIRVEDKLFTDVYPYEYGKEKLAEWQIKKYGDIPKIDGIPPKQKIQTFWRTVDIGFKENEMRYIQYSTRVKYKGSDKREYKYSLDYMYVVDGVRSGKPLVTNRLFEPHLGEDNDEIPEIKNLIDDYKKKAE